MEFDFDEDELVFSTGKRVYANNCIIGITDEIDVGCRITYGYDGGITEKELTAEEKIELANKMIDVWNRYLDKIKTTL